MLLTLLALLVSGSYQVQYSYTTNGQRQTMTDASGVTTYTYDNRDRLRTNATPQGTVYYAYNANGSVTNIWSSTTSGVNLRYGYDSLSLITNVLANGNAAADYSFDAVGNLQKISYGNGVTNRYQYDSLNRLTNLIWKLSGAARGDFSYLLGLTGNRTNLLETVDGISRTNTWKYDSLYRLTNEISRATSDSGTNVYAYDAVGNRLTRTVTGFAVLTNQTLNFDNNDRLDNDSNTNTTSAWFDANGNSTNYGGAYQYDVENRLTNANSGAVQIVYNGDGQRVKKITASSTNLYLVDNRNPSGYAQVLEELTVSGGTTNLSKLYNYGLDLVSQKDSGGTVYYFGYDGHGSTRFLLNSSGNVSQTFAYDAYGTMIASNAAPATVYLYAGEQFDPNLGFYYLRARYLNQNVGRFQTSDSYDGNSSDPLSLHKYIYCHGNPVNGTDPSGNEMNLNGMQIATAISVTINAWSAGVNIRKGNYAMAAVDILSMGFGIGGMGGPGAFKQLATIANASRGVTFASWVAAARGAQQVSQGVAIFDILMMAMSGASTGATIGQSGGSDSSDIYENGMADQYNFELMKARIRGVQSTTVNSLEQLKSLLDQSPVLKWVVTADNKLKIVPKRIDGTEISHAVAAENQGVKAAGEARMRGNFLEVNRWSGHYRGQTWTPGQRAFEKMGLPVILKDGEFN